ncbi:MAG: SurA N-terminal domain-containing protein [Gemmatimonadota bacterium]
MMQAFRNSATPLITIVAIAFFAWLVFDLSGLTGGSGFLTTTSVGKINGQSVESRAFQEAVSRATEQRQRESTQSLGIAEVSQIRDQVWEQFIQEHILEEEYRRVGISASPQEIAEAIRYAPPPEFQQQAEFQTDGAFDQTKYERWLASSGGQALIPLLDAQYRGQILQSKLARHLVADVYPSDPELWERYRDLNEMATVGVVEVGRDVVTDASITVTPTEVGEYFGAHPDEFKSGRTAWLSYVVLDRRPIASDTMAAQVRANAIRAEIVCGVPFDEVARRESADTISGSKGGDLGEWSRGSFDPTFETAAWSLPLNTVSQPVATPFGYHLIEITKRSADKATGRHILIPIEVTGAHREQLDTRADSLEALAADVLDPAALDTAARALGLQIIRTGPVVEGGEQTTIADAMIWAFQAETGENSPVIETPGAFFVFRVDSMRAAGVPPMAAIQSEIENRIRQQKKAAEARKLGQELATRGRTEGLAKAAAALGLDYKVSGPFNRVNAGSLGGQALGAAFALTPGEVSAPIEWQGSFWVLQGVARTAADSAQFAAGLPAFREQAIGSARQLMIRQYFTALRAKAKVVDNRSVIYQTAAQAEAAAGAIPGQQPR